MTITIALRQIRSHHPSIRTEMEAKFKLWIEAGASVQTALNQANVWMLAEYQRRTPTEIVVPVSVEPLESIQTSEAIPLPGSTAVR